MGSAKKNAAAELEVRELLNETNYTKTDQPSMHNDELESVNTSTHKETDINNEDTFAENKSGNLRNYFYLQKCNKNVSCYSGIHNNYTNTFAILKLFIDDEIKWINFCETCILKFLEISQEFYACDLTYIKTTEDEIINMSISYEITNENCKFCNKEQSRIARIEIRNRSFSMCKACLNKLINKVAFFIRKNTSKLEVNDIKNYFEESHIDYQNILEFQSEFNNKYKQLFYQYREAVNRKNKNINALNKRILNQRTNLTSLQNKKEQLIKENNGLIKQITKKDKKIELLNHELERKNEIINEQSKSINDFENKIKSQKQHLNQLTEDIIKRKESLSKANKDNMELRKQLAELKKI